MHNRRFHQLTTVNGVMLRTFLAALAVSPSISKSGQAVAGEPISMPPATNCILSEAVGPDVAEIKGTAFLSAPTLSPELKRASRVTELSRIRVVQLASRSIAGKTSVPVIFSGPCLSALGAAALTSPSVSPLRLAKPAETSFRSQLRYIAAPLDTTENVSAIPIGTEMAPAALTDNPAPALPQLIAAPQSPSEPVTVVPIAAVPPATPAAPADAPAPTNAELQARLEKLQQRLNQSETEELSPVFLVLPSISSNVPNGYGASQGMAAFGFGYQNRLRYTDHKQDGTVAMVLGLSDPRKLGVDVQFSALDLSRFGHRTAIGFKLHRQLGSDYALAFGGENALVWPNSDSESSYYLVLSKKLRLAESGSQPFSRVFLSAGLGTGRYRSERGVFSDRGSVNVFGSAAVNVTKSTTAFAEWTGQSLDVGASIIPIRNYPFIVTLSLADIAGDGGDGNRFTAGFGYVLPH